MPEEALFILTFVYTFRSHILFCFVVLLPMNPCLPSGTFLDDSRVRIKQ